MRLSTLSRCKPLVEDGGKERVREPDGSVGDLDDPFGDRGIERGRVDAGGLKLTRRQPRIRGREHEGVARRAREAGETSREELLQAVRNGQRLRRVTPTILGAERAGQLEGVERVPT